MEESSTQSTPTSGIFPTVQSPNGRRKPNCERNIMKHERFLKTLLMSARTKVCFRFNCFTMATLSGAGVEAKENLEKSAEEKAEDEKKKREEEIEKILMVKIGPPPEKPLPGDCCGSGCETCVWNTFFDQLQEYKKEKDSILKSISPP